jgi:hypothetical protein
VGISEELGTSLRGLGNVDSAEKGLTGTSSPAPKPNMFTKFLRPDLYSGRRNLVNMFGLGAGDEVPVRPFSAESTLPRPLSTLATPLSRGAGTQLSRDAQASSQLL